MPRNYDDSTSKGKQNPGGGGPGGNTVKNETPKNSVSWGQPDNSNEGEEKQ